MNYNISLVLKAKGEGYPPLSSGAVRIWLFRERLSALARKSLKRELGARGRHQCVLWHRGDPAGWTWHKSLGAWFDPSIARKAEDLRELLLRTPLSNVYKHHKGIWHARVPALKLTLFLSRTACFYWLTRVSSLTIDAQITRHKRLTSQAASNRDWQTETGF